MTPQGSFMPGELSARARDIDALLPQTQCTRCGYAGCAPYARAIDAGETGINHCPPGGADTITALARLLDREPHALDSANGEHTSPKVVWIDPAACIGCARCLPPCPVDAILGAHRFLHTVISERCTGCELCIAPCPVDCIHLRDAPPSQPPNDPPLNRQRFEAHLAREAQRSEHRAAELADKKRALAAAARAP
ncbi:MAG: RnfABCDGE type electron transport complex subunit B [Steroidobacteraceae bacterium]